VSLSCPYCREEIITIQQVICDACQTPHHYDCWKENGGCTVFGCTRGPKEEEKITVSQQDLYNIKEKKYYLNSHSVQTGPFSQAEVSTMFQKGSVNSSTFVWGPEMTEWAPLEQMSYKFKIIESTIPTYSESLNIQSTESELMKIFVKDNYSYYQDKWKDPKKIGYNYAGFWVNVWWLAYRKMYGHWAIAALGYMLVGWIPLLGIAISYSVGRQANGWYLEHCKKKVKEICPDGILNDFRKQELEKQGGGSWISAIGLNIITFLITVFIYAAIKSK